MKSLSGDLDIPAERFIGLNDGQTISADGLWITGIVASHEFIDMDENGLYPYLGYVIGINGHGETVMY